jgi:hypothetical protein
MAEMGQSLQLPMPPDFRRLPVRAIAAHAARSARRVRALFVWPEPPLDFERRCTAVERAINVAERFCRGESVSTVEAADAAAEAAIAADVAYNAYAAHAAYAADAASCAAQIVAGAHARAVDAAIAAAIAYAFAYFDEEAVDLVSRRAADAAQADYDKLLGLQLGSYPETGRPIASSEDGPLGALWGERRGHPP